MSAEDFYIVIGESGIRTVGQLQRITMQVSLISTYKTPAGTYSIYVDSVGVANGSVIATDYVQVIEAQWTPSTAGVHTITATFTDLVGTSHTNALDITISETLPPDGDGTNTANWMKLALLFGTCGLALVVAYFLNKSIKEEPKTELLVLPIVDAPTAGKEGPFLQYNKEEMFKGFLAAEGHLRNVKEPKKKIREMGIEDKGFLNCIVKHAADIESHADEAVSHSLVIEGKDKSEKFRTLRDSVRNYRRNLQTGDLSIDQAILGVRDLRRQFESFNPSYDISHCDSCSVEVKVLKD